MNKNITSDQVCLHICNVFCQMLHLSMRRKPTLTVWGQRSTGSACRCLSSARVTSEQTCPSMQSQGTALNMEVRECRSWVWVLKYILEYLHVYPKYAYFNIKKCFFLFCYFGSEVMDKTTAKGWNPVDVARAVLKAVCHKQKDVVLAGPLPTAAVYLRTLWPTLYFRLMASRAVKEQRVKEE